MGSHRVKEVPPEGQDLGEACALQKHTLWRLAACTTGATDIRGIQRLGGLWGGAIGKRGGVAPQKPGEGNAVCCCLGEIVPECPRLPHTGAILLGFTAAPQQGQLRPPINVLLEIRVGLAANEFDEVCDPLNGRIC